MLDREKRQRSYRFLDIPAYKRWAERKLDEGVSYDLIAHFDCYSMELLPEELDSVDESDFDEMLEDLRKEIGDTE